MKELINLVIFYENRLDFFNDAKKEAKENGNIWDIGCRSGQIIQTESIINDLKKIIKDLEE